MVNIPDQEIVENLKPYGFTPNESQILSIHTYIELLLQWNQRISLTTVTKVPEILRFHFGESLFARSLVQIAHSRLADVGTGAGFPGLALKIGVPEIQLTLIESNTKKAAFLAEVVRMLKLERVQIYRGRMEDFPDDSGMFDYITARAVGKHDDLLGWARSRLGESGKMLLWLGESDVIKTSKLQGWNWQSPLLIPGSERRFILIGTPKK